MAAMNVSQFATELNLPAALLLEQLRAAGLDKSGAEDALSEQDKAKLLDYLREVHGHKDAKTKITLTRKQTTEIKKSDSTGKARTIQVEVRKKRVLVKRDTPEAPVAEAVAEPEVKPAPVVVVDEEQQRIREEEARRQAELIARQAAEAAGRPKRKTKKEIEAEAAAAKAAEEAKQAEEAAKAAVKPSAEPAPEAAPAAAEAAKAPRAAEGTLHRPTGKPAEKKPAKKAAKPAASTWVDEAAKRRAIKTRGDTGGGRDTWRGGPRGRARHAE